MAVSDILNTVANLAQLEAQKGEADKDRGMRIAELKFRSDQEELARLQRMEQDAFKNLNQMAAKFSEITGIERNLNDLQLESGLRSDAMSVVGAEKASTAQKIMDLQNRLRGYNKEAMDIASDYSRFGAGKQDWEPIFEKYREAVSRGSIVERGTMGPEEWKMAISELPEELREDDVYLAGLKTAISGFGSPKRVEQMLKEAQLDLMGRRLSAEMSEGGSDAFRRSIMDRYNALRESYGPRLRAWLDEESVFTLPKAPLSTQDVSQHMFGIARNFAEYVDKFEDSDIKKITDESGNASEVLGEYKKAKEKGDTDAMNRTASRLTNMFSNYPGSVGELDFWRTFIFGALGKSDSEKAQLGSDLLEGYNILSDLEQAGYGTNRFNDKSYLQVMIENSMNRAGASAEGFEPSPSHPSFLDWYYEHRRQTPVEGDPKLREVIEELDKMTIDPAERRLEDLINLIEKKLPKGGKMKVSEEYLRR